MRFAGSCTLVDYVENQPELLPNVKSLLDRVTGKFYTHEIIGKQLCKKLALNFRDTHKEKDISIIDPFCGDGRLICWWIEACLDIDVKFKSIHISLWDCDENSLLLAKEKIKKMASEISSVVYIEAISCDSFQYIFNQDRLFDICLTNPPWEVLKPDQREIGHLSPDDAEEYRRLIAVKSNFIKSNFSISVPNMRFAGWGINLARAGLELSVNIVKNDGLLGIVMPASFLADQVSLSLREWFFKKMSLSDIGYFSAEGRFFKGVDQPCITMLGYKKTSVKKNVKIEEYLCDGSINECFLSDEDWTEIEQRNFVIPVHFGISSIAILKLFNKFPSIAQIEKSNIKIKIGREMDETGISGLLKPKGDCYFVKGKDVSRFSSIGKTSQCIDYRDIKNNYVLDKKRLVWRDVARQSQKRRMHAAIIDAGCISGNSLNVLFTNENDNLLYYFLGLFNSYVFEYQARMLLATSHVSAGAVRRVRVPLDLSSNDFDTICTLSKKAEFDLESEMELEVRVCMLYGLSKDNFELILDAFPKMEADEKKLILSHSLWDSYDSNSLQVPIVGKSAFKKDQLALFL